MKTTFFLFFGLVVFSLGLGGCAGSSAWFKVYDDDVILDKMTNLEWYVGQDRDMSWDEAKKWIDSLTVAGGGWRMPTLNELRGLYQSGKGTRNIFKTSGFGVWSCEVREDPAGSAVAGAWTFSLTDHFNMWVPLNRGYGDRAFAVRASR